MIKEMEKLKKMPTSQLIFYMTFAKDYDNYNPDKVKLVLFKRLLNRWRLSLEEANNIIKRDQQIMNKIGNDINSYLFYGKQHLSDILGIAFENVDEQHSMNDFEKHFNSLTISELVVCYMTFSNIVDLHEKKKKYFLENTELLDINSKVIEQNDLMARCIGKRLINIIGDNNIKQNTIGCELRSEYQLLKSNGFEDITSYNSYKEQIKELFNNSKEKTFTKKTTI